MPGIEKWILVLKNGSPHKCWGQFARVSRLSFRSLWLCYGLTNVEQIDQIGESYNQSYTFYFRGFCLRRRKNFAAQWERQNWKSSRIDNNKEFSPVQPIAAAAHSVPNNDRLSKLENLVEKLPNQVSQLASNKNDSNNANIC